MEDLDLKVYLDNHSKMYRLNPSSNDILVVTIPSAWYYRASALEKVQKLINDMEELFESHNRSIPVLVLPDDMKLFNLTVESLVEMEEVESELDGFEDDFRL